MDDIFIVAKVQKLIKDNMQSVVDAICTGGVDNMENINICWDR